MQLNRSSEYNDTPYSILLTGKMYQNVHYNISIQYFPYL